MGLYLGSNKYKVNTNGQKFNTRYYEPPAVVPNYLTFASDDTFSISVSSPQWDGTMYYSTDTKNWSEWDGSEISGTAVYLRGTGNTEIIGRSMSSYKWTLTGSNISCVGNIENLLDYDTVLSGAHPTLANYCYSNMFNGCTSLTTAPELPATTLANYCYSNMFNGCTSLTTAPELPATTLANYCYSNMFNGCTSLTTAPELPATTLAKYCYSNMFNGCTSLTTAPELPATTLANYCYSNMFNGCTSLTTAPELPATTLANYCYSNMFNGCTSLTTAPELPATTLANYCYSNMFNGCTSLTTAPELPATTLAEYCYYRMFRGCTSIKLSSTQTDEYIQKYQIPITGNGTMNYLALNNMFSNTGGTFTGTPSINTAYYLHSSNSIV